MRVPFRPPFGNQTIIQPSLPAQRLTALRPCFAAGLPLSCLQSFQKIKTIIDGQTYLTAFAIACQEIVSSPILSNGALPKSRETHKMR
jgi:hypothetical protein